MNDRQPVRHDVAGREERRFDRTFLSERNHGQRVHRDYAAHFFRWGWVGQRFHQGNHVLDVGCGPEGPLAKLLTNQGYYPGLYVGVDLNKFEPPMNAQWAYFLPGEDFVELDAVLRARLLELCPKKFTDGVCFEVIEHMKPDDGFQLLANFHEFIQPGGHLYLSTPVFNGHAAVNHVHEYTIPELQELLDATSWKVVKRYGTFANRRDVEKVATPEQLALVKQLSEYYSNDVLNCFLAPLYPDAARNNLWHLERS